MKTRQVRDSQQARGPQASAVAPPAQKRRSTGAVDRPQRLAAPLGCMISLRSLLSNSFPTLTRSGQYLTFQAFSFLPNILCWNQLSEISLFVYNTMAEEKQEDPQPPAPEHADTKAKGKKSNSSAKSSTIPSKRKAKAPSSPSKAPRRSARSVPKNARSPIQILHFLLSPDSLTLTRPKDEVAALSDSEPDAKVRTYSESEFTAFEELMCAVILSRPISHALGVRSIRTLLSPPYEFSTPEKLKEAGFEGVRKALDEARTQHRQKTAEELVGLGEAVTGPIGEGKGSWEEAVREKLKEDVDEVLCFKDLVDTSADSDRDETYYPRTSRA